MRISTSQLFQTPAVSSEELGHAKDRLNSRFPNFSDAALYTQAGAERVERLTRQEA